MLFLRDEPPTGPERDDLRSAVQTANIVNMMRAALASFSKHGSAKQQPVKDFMLKFEGMAESTGRIISVGSGGKYTDADEQFEFLKAWTRTVGGRVVEAEE